MRLLTLPVMVTLMPGLLWRQLGSVSELVQVVRCEAVLWVPPLPAGLDAAVANLAGGTVRVAVQIQGIALWTNIS